MAANGFTGNAHRGHGPLLQECSALDSLASAQSPH